jgi:hypothetical protein
LQSLLAFLALHEQVCRRKSLETRRTGDDEAVPEAELEEGEQFTLDEVLQLVADRAVEITGADGLATWVRASTAIRPSPEPASARPGS